MTTRGDLSRCRAGVIRTLLLAAALAACSDEAKVAAPSDATVSVSASSTALSFSGTATISAQVVGANGLPLDGVSVSFMTTLGSVQPAEAVTKAGTATTTFDAGAVSGTATITAFARGGTSSTITIAVGVAAVARVAVIADPPTVRFGGGTSSITATVTDGAGNPLATIPVSFTTTAGAVTPLNVKTDPQGVARTTLTTTAQAVVTATATRPPVDNGGAASVSGTTTVAVAPQPKPVVSVTVAPNPMAGAPATFTLSVTPAPDSNTTIESVSIAFGDGASTNLGAVSGAGITVQHVYEEGGEYTATVTATDSGGGSTIVPAVVAVGHGAPLSVSVVAGGPVPAGTQSIVTLTATVSPDTATVATYRWDFGDGSDPVTTTGPQVQHLFKQRADPYKVTVTVTTAGTGRQASGFAFVLVPPSSPATNR